MTFIELVGGETWLVAEAIDSVCRADRARQPTAETVIRMRSGLEWTTTEAPKEFIARVSRIIALVP